MMSPFKLGMQWYKGWNRYSSWPSMSGIPVFGQKGNERKGGGLRAGMCWICGTAPPEYKTGTNLLKPIGAQGKLLHKHSADNKMFWKALKLNGWGVNSVEASVTMERDCARTERCHWAGKGMPSGRGTTHTADTQQGGLRYTLSSHSGPWACARGRTGGSVPRAFGSCDTSWFESGFLIHHSPQAYCRPDLLRTNVCVS